jgi:hypothetical protein
MARKARLIGMCKISAEAGVVFSRQIERYALVLLHILSWVAGSVVPAIADDIENYDLNTEVVVEGTVTGEVSRDRGPRVFLLKSRDTIYQVHTGPWWYLDQIGLTIKKDMEIEVTGSKLYDSKGDLSLIIYSLKDLNSEKTYPFRDDKLTPLWRGRGRGKGIHHQAPTE